MHFGAKFLPRPYFFYNILIVVFGQIIIAVVIIIDTIIFSITSSHINIITIRDRRLQMQKQIFGNGWQLRVLLGAVVAKGPGSSSADGPSSEALRQDKWKPLGGGASLPVHSSLGLVMGDYCGINLDGGRLNKKMFFFRCCQNYH